MSWVRTGVGFLAASSHMLTSPRACSPPALSILRFILLSPRSCATCLVFLLSPRSCPALPSLPRVPQVLKIPGSRMSVCLSVCLTGDTVSTALLRMPSTSPFLRYYLTFQRLPFKRAISQRASRGQLSPSWPWMPRQAVARRGIPLGRSRRLWLVLCQARQKIRRGQSRPGSG